MGLTLFPYQDLGATFLASRRRALLADDMGLGKTVQAIIASRYINAKRVIVICPAIVCQTWDAEFHRWGLLNLPVNVIRSAKDPIPCNGVVIISYDLAVQRQAQLNAWSYDLLILDESHFLKNRNAQRTQAIYGANLDGAGGIAGPADRVWCLSGAPAPNNDPTELYPMLRFFGVWKNGYGQFLNDYTVWKDHPTFGIRVTGVKNPDALRSMLEPVMLRRMKADVLTDLPPITVSEVSIDPAECEATEGVLAQLREEEPHVADRIKRAIETDDWSFDGDEQIARVRRLVGLAKVAGVCELIKHELANGLQKIVVFGWHTEFLLYLKRYLPDADLIYGQTSASKRQQIIQAFQTERTPRVLGLQIKTAGIGLTLTAAHHVLIAEPSWTPADNDQAMMRCHRIGQTMPVLVRFATAAGTIDDAVTGVLRRKSAAVASFLS